MKTIRQAAIDALLLAARNSRRIGDAPVMTLIEVVAELDNAGLLNGPNRKDRASVAAEGALRNGIEAAMKRDGEVDIRDDLQRLLDDVEVTDSALAMCELVHSAEAAIAALSDEGFPGRNIEAQVRHIIVAWSEEREKVRRLRDVSNPRAVALQALIQLHDLAESFDDEALGQSSMRLQYQFQAQEGFETLGLDGIDAARAEMRADAEPLDPDAPIPYTLSEPPSNAAPEVAGGEPCPKCGEPLTMGGDCFNFDKCSNAAIIPF